MNKKLIAIAITGAFGGPAVVHAQASTVQMYGRVYYEYSYFDQGRGANGERVNVDLMQTPGSNIGFKGEEKLGGGVAAWFQCESTADVRGVSQEGFCSRNSGIGLKGSFGTVWMGKWDTPFKRAVSLTMYGGIPLSTGTFGPAFLLTGGSTSTLDNSARATFRRRQANTVNYNSPVFGGFQVLASFSSTNGATARTTTEAGAKPRLYSVAGVYKNGPLTVAAAYDLHQDFARTATFSGDDTGWLLGASYLIGTVKVSGLYTEQKFELGPATESKFKGWSLGATWRFSGPHGLKTQYTRAGDMTGNGTAGIVGSGTFRPVAGPDTGAKLWSIHYSYLASKRTEFLVGYADLRNDANAQYALGGTFGTTAATLPAKGNKESAWGLVVSHRF